MCGSADPYACTQEALFRNIFELEPSRSKLCSQQEDNHEHQSSVVSSVIHGSVAFFHGIGYVNSCIQQNRLQENMHWKAGSQIEVAGLPVTRIPGAVSSPAV